GRRRFHEESRQPLPKSIACQLEATGFERLIAFVPAPPKIVRGFPMDSGLGGLQLATDMESMSALLAQHLRACGQNGWQPQGLTYQVLNYKPGRSCRLHYHLVLDREPGSAPETHQFYGKVYRDDRDNHC